MLQGIEKFDQEYKRLEDLKNEALAVHRRRYFEESIEEYRKIIESMADKPVSQADKKRIQNDFVILRDEFIDFLDLQLKASVIKDAIDRLNVSVDKKKFQKR